MIAELTERLLARSGRGAKYGLERITAALERLGHPERDLRVVHVAGTNGKGSVCAMVDAMARAAGHRVGVFTSPHLCRLNERIRLDGEPIADAPFAAALKVALDAEPPVTFFEAVTIAGFWAMREAQVDLAVFEVGLGGRLDATNVIPPPACAVITSIGHDHTRLLGEDLVAIAGEKAGIIKRGAPVVIGPMDDAAKDTIVAVARERESGPVTIITAADGRDVNLAGPHQRLNAATAAAAVAALTDPVAVPEDARLQGLQSVTWPGRLERLERDGITILLDCAHNVHAARALVAALADQPPAHTHLVFGALGDKQWREMLELIGPLAAQRHYCTPLSELAGRKPVPPGALAAVLEGTPHPSKAAAVEAALAGAEPGDTVLVTGSIFLVGGVRTYLSGEDADVPVPL